MGEKLTEKYGLSTAIAMVVGIVIGSGVFFKAQDILNYTGGDIKKGVLAWLIGGAVMIVCTYTFSCMAAKYEKVNGIVDYAETTCGARYAYILGWFAAVIYYPSMTSVLAWASARFTCVLFGIENAPGGTECLALAGFYLIESFVINAVLPKFAGKFQVLATVIKLLPLVLMAVAGTVGGLIKGTAVDAFTRVLSESGGGALFSAVAAAAFAYEGWIIATGINSEIKNSKKNLPIALTLGSVTVVVIYVAYFIGISGGASVDMLMSDGATAAFTNLFGTVGGTILNIFVAVSCIGTLNGLMLGCCRGMYSLAARNEGIKPEIMGEVSGTGIPVNSAIAEVMLCALWLLFWYGGVVRCEFNGQKSWWGILTFDSSELPTITIYAFYIPIFFRIMILERDFSLFKRFVMPALAIIACVFMIFAAFIAHRADVIRYLIVFSAIMAAGIWVMKPKSNLKM